MVVGQHDPYLGAGQELLKLEGHSDDVSSVSFSPDGRRIVG